MEEHSRRRKFIKGSLAAPLVLTVGKAGATARTTFSACLSNSKNRPEPVHAVVEQDEAFRVSRDVYEVHRRKGREDDKPIKPEDQSGREGGRQNRSENQYVLGWDNETLYRIDGSQLVAQQFDNDPGNFLRTFEIERRPTGKKVDILAYVDKTGNVVGIAPQRNGGQWATKRCYSSLVGVHEDDTPPQYRWWG